MQQAFLRYVYIRTDIFRFCRKRDVFFPLLLNYLFKNIFRNRSVSGRYPTTQTIHNIILYIYIYTYDNVLCPVSFASVYKRWFINKVCYYYLLLLLINTCESQSNSVDHVRAFKTYIYLLIRSAKLIKYNNT